MARRACRRTVIVVLAIVDVVVVLVDVDVVVAVFDGNGNGNLQWLSLFVPCGVVAAPLVPSHHDVSRQPIIDEGIYSKEVVMITAAILSTTRSLGH